MGISLRDVFKISIELAGVLFTQDALFNDNFEDRSHGDCILKICYSISNKAS